jgi:hypothetical protein
MPAESISLSVSEAIDNLKGDGTEGIYSDVVDRVRMEDEELVFWMRDSGGPSYTSGARICDMLDN